MYKISTSNVNIRQRTASFLWQHSFLLISLYIMTLGVALCIRSNLGSSVISSMPFVFSLAGENAENAIPAWSVGIYTILMNFVFVLCQILVMRRNFDPMQLFQLLIGFVFGWLIDMNMMLTSVLDCETLPMQIVTQLAGCTVMGIGIALEVKCGSVTMPGEGISICISKVLNRPFPKVKIAVDTTIVVLAVMFCYIFFGQWLWNVVGAGTLFAMIYVGLVVKFTAARTKWFDRLLHYTPGFRRYLIGLARLRNKL